MFEFRLQRVVVIGHVLGLIRDAAPERVRPSSLDGAWTRCERNVGIVCRAEVDTTIADIADLKYVVIGELMLHIHAVVNIGSHAEMNACRVNRRGGSSRAKGGAEKVVRQVSCGRNVLG